MHDLEQLHVSGDNYGASLEFAGCKSGYYRDNEGVFRAEMMQAWIAVLAFRAEMYGAALNASL